MKISRLDKIIENNVALSIGKHSEEQKVGILQDISETLAMIYDKLCEDNINRNKIDTTPKIIPFECLLFGEKIHIEYLNFDEEDIADFVKYETEELLSIKNDEKKTDVYAVFKAKTGNDIRLKQDEYEKTWRCWNIEPTEEERKNKEWVK